LNSLFHVSPQRQKESFLDLLSFRYVGGKKRIKLKTFSFIQLEAIVLS
jgi:hypothetical protein